MHEYPVPEVHRTLKSFAHCVSSVKITWHTERDQVVVIGSYRYNPASLVIPDYYSRLTFSSGCGLEMVSMQKKKIA